jgi:hypothetical protein
MTSRFVVLAIVPLVVASYLIRTVLIAVFHGRAPRVAAAADRLWAWVPLVVVLLAITFVSPILGVVATVAMAIFLTSNRAIGSPFRPRR